MKKIELAKSKFGRTELVQSKLNGTKRIRSKSQVRAKRFRSEMIINCRPKRVTGPRAKTVGAGRSKCVGRPGPKLSSGPGTEKGSWPRAGRSTWSFIVQWLEIRTARCRSTKTRSSTRGTEGILHTGTTCQGLVKSGLGLGFRTARGRSTRSTWASRSLGNTVLSCSLSGSGKSFILCRAACKRLVEGRLGHLCFFRGCACGFGSSSKRLFLGGSIFNCFGKCSLSSLIVLILWRAAGSVSRLAFTWLTFSISGNLLSVTITRLSVC